MSENPNSNSITPRTGAIEISNLRRISVSHPTAWEGQVHGGTPAHIGYRFGILTVSVGFPAVVEEGRVLRRMWKDIVQIRPAFMMAEIAVIRRVRVIEEYKKARAEGKVIFPPEGVNATPAGLKAMRNRLRLEAQRRIDGEVRAANGDRPRVVTIWELREWLLERNNYLGELRFLGEAGGEAPVSIRGFSREE